MKPQHQKKISITETVTKAVGSTASLIVHTALFAGFFIAGALGVFSWNSVLLVLTTLVSLEAIYLAIFIQMSVNKNTESLAEVEEDIGEIEENLEEIQEDIGEIEEDIGEIEENLDEIQEDVGEIHEEVDELAEDDTESEQAARKTQDSLDRIQEALAALTQEIERLKKSR
jgi:septal ring factor EnvC (AmiA/AmiB activator)